MSRRPGWISTSTPSWPGLCGIPRFFLSMSTVRTTRLCLRVPGIGVKSARLIVSSRRYRTLTQQSLRQIGVVMKKAQYFISCRELTAGQGVNELRPEQVRRLLTAPQRRRQDRNEGQLTLF